MDKPIHYDVAIIGGGLAGLSASILIAKAGFSVVLFEKERYPFHKVCGEYISLECWNLLISLGVDLDELSLPVIGWLNLSSANGQLITQKLPLGGFGVSRFVIDDILMNLALEQRIEVHEGTRVTDIKYNNNRFVIHAGGFGVSSTVCCGTFGKRSNLDIKWGRDFIREKPNALNNFIGVKYHAELDIPRDQISLHHFAGGYCGVSPIEENKTCICYLTTAHNLKTNGSDIRQMEENILYKNQFIRKIFTTAKMLYDQPQAISQVSFDKKSRIENHVLLIGDAAGMIAPLCGNGMSMALHGSRIAAEEIIRFLKGETTREGMELKYGKRWDKTFSGRLKTGRIIQRVFGNETLTKLTVGALGKFPYVLNKIISRTHGY